MHRSLQTSIRPTVAVRALSLGLALVMSVGMFGSSAKADVTPVLVLSSANAGVYQPVRGDGYLAWEQNSRSNPNHYDVLMRPDGGGSVVRVNPSGTNGANGSIDGGVIVYQQYGRKQSNIQLFDIATHQRKNPPNGVNAGSWEYWPHISGKWLLFGRLKSDGSRVLLLLDRSSGKIVTLDSTKSSRAFIGPAEVSGDWAVWYRCLNGLCDVIRDHLTTGQRFTIPRPRGTSQHAPAVSPDGTVFFVRSGKQCGDGATVMRYSIKGPGTTLLQIPSSSDVNSMDLYTDPTGGRSLYFDQATCGRAASSQVWRIDNPDGIFLSVSTDGTGGGTVTSNPAGINCGHDCTRGYANGTDVTLTANPDGKSTFGGWTGACTDTSPTCPLTMDQSKSVTATFVPQNQLVVTLSGSGSGNVKSNPSGIDCGNTCSATFAPGTQVTLTASANPDSMFTGWSGACGGTSDTCTVTMSGSGTKSVATNFVLRRSLTVTRSGDGPGTVTSNPAGINCSGLFISCSHSWPPGTDVTLTATPGANTTFTGWSSNCALDASTPPKCTVTISNSGNNVTATFNTDKTLTVDVNGGDTTGTVTSNPSGINCPSTTCAHAYTHSTSVTLTETPNSGSSFTGWSGALCDSTTATTCTLTMTSAKSVTAAFNTDKTLAVSVSAPLLSTSKVHVNDGSTSGYDCTATTSCMQSYPYGTSITLTADPSTPIFTGWTGGPCDSTTTNPCQFAMTADTSVTANFSARHSSQGLAYLARRNLW